MPKFEEQMTVESQSTTTCASSSQGTPAPKSPFESRSPSFVAPHEDIAWLTVFGAVLALFCCGQLTAFGAFETWYAENQLRGLTASTIAWIGSLQLWVLYFSGGILGRIFDAYGPRVILIPGSILLVVSTMMTSVCIKYYQFLLVQGLLTGLAYGMLFYPSFASISTHFRKYRATAVGIAIAGSGVGGVVFPIMFRQLFAEIGFGWAVRLVGFLCLGLCAVTCATVTSRIPLVRKLPRYFRMQRSSKIPLFFCSLRAAFWSTLVGLFIPFVYLADYSIYRGISSGTSFYIISAMNAGSILGRIAPPFLADKVGRFNIAVPSTFLMGLLALLFWMFAKSLIAIVFFAAIYGCFSGAFLAMQIPCIAQISDIEEVGTRIGILYSVASYGVLAGGPAAGAVLKSDHGTYTGMIILCGVLNILGSLLLLWSKLRVNGQIFARV
ncbi:major facilitator superfamily domain-containing protein [Trametes punicea]|nr:major facilitator superfamily domain-containing protein [Trametes punicea]